MNVFLFFLISCLDKYINENIFNYIINNKESNRKLEDDDLNYRDINILFDIRTILSDYDYFIRTRPGDDETKEIGYLINFLGTFNNTLKKLIKIKKSAQKEIRISNKAFEDLKERTVNNFEHIKARFSSNKQNEEDIKVEKLD